MRIRWIRGIRCRPDLRAVLLFVFGWVSLCASPAWACGGCFGPLPTGSVVPTGPGIVQTAERVLFVQGGKDNITRVWVEIRYSGPAKDFAWVLPLPAKPKVGVGSSWIFDRLDLATAPRFSLEPLTDENCAIYTPPRGYGADAGSSTDPVNGYEPGGCGYSASESAGYQVSGGPSGSWSGDGAVATDSDQTSAKGGRYDVDLLEHDQVGPYSYDIIESKNPVDLKNWLESRGYAVPATAEPIIASHVAKGDVFLAVRLKSGAAVNEIRPIALEMQDAEPCVPLRLTSIGAVPDTSVVVYLAGAGRGVPRNTLHVEPNILAFSWLSGAGNYQQLLSAAFDEAAGHAFATEFAGATKGLQVPESQSLLRRSSRFGFNDGLYEPGPALVPPGAPADVFGETATIFDFLIAFNRFNVTLSEPVVKVIEQHTGLAALMKRTDLLEFYRDLQLMQVVVPSGHFTQAVDGDALAKALNALLEKDDLDATGAEAMIAAIESQSTLTRLVMLISPEEMDRDPVFAFNPLLPMVKTEYKATVNAVCKDGWYPAEAVRLTVDGYGSWVIDAPNAKYQAFPFGANHLGDPRFAGMPFARNIAMTDYTSAAPIPVPTGWVDAVDSAILGNKPGDPGWPQSIAFGKAVAWKPPASDSTVIGKQSYSGGVAQPRRSPLRLLWVALLLVVPVLLRRAMPTRTR